MNKDRLLLSSIYFLFHAGLMAYKLFHPLWFYEQGKLEYFAVGYAFMALGGIISGMYFLLFANMMRISFLLSLSGVLLSTGICVSCIPFHIGYSIIGGLISGFGATTFMNVLYRITHMKESKESIIVDVPQVINYSKFIGTLVSVVVAYFVAILDSNNLTGILVSCGLAFISWMPLFFFKIKHEVYDDIEILHRDPLTVQKVKRMYKQKPFLLLAIIALNFIGGAFVNMCMPFFPVIMKIRGLDLLSLGIFSSVSYVFGALAHKIIHRCFHPKFHVKGLALSCLLLIGATSMLATLSNAWITGISVLLYSMFYGAYGVWRKSIEHEVLPRNQMPDYINFGGQLFQISIFLSLIFSSYLFHNVGITTIFHSASMLTFLSIGLTLLFLYKNLVQDFNEYMKKHNLDI